MIAVTKAGILSDVQVTSVVALRLAMRAVLLRPAVQRDRAVRTVRLAVRNVSLRFAKPDALVVVSRSSCHLEASSACVPEVVVLDVDVVDEAMEVVPGAEHRCRCAYRLDIVLVVQKWLVRPSVRGYLTRVNRQVRCVRPVYRRVIP